MFTVHEIFTDAIIKELNLDATSQLGITASLLSTQKKNYKYLL